MSLRTTFGETSELLVTMSLRHGLALSPYIFARIMDVVNCLYLKGGTLEYVV